MSSRKGKQIHLFELHMDYRLPDAYVDNLAQKAGQLPASHCTSPAAKGILTFTVAKH